MTHTAMRGGEPSRTAVQPARGGFWIRLRRCCAALAVALAAGTIVAVLGAATAVAQTDLQIVKVGPASAVAGTQFSYTINVANNGPNAAANVSVTDLLPAGLTLVSATASAGWSVNAAGNTVTFSVASFANGDIASHTITVKLASSFSAGSISNTATVSSSTSESNPGNNASTTTTSVSTQADLSLTKSGPANAAAGSLVSYTITVQNNGPSDAQNASVTDILPAALIFQTSTANGGWTPSGTTFTNPTFAAGATATLTITAQVNGATPNGTVINNTATISSATPEINAGNNASTASTSVKAATAATLTSSNNPSRVGDAVTFTATVTGASPTGTVTFSDGATALGTAPLSGGVASLTTSALTAGAHTITAAYSGDATNQASSASLSQSVGPPLDSVRLRMMQIVGTKIESQSSGQAVSGAIDAAIGDGFSANGPPIMASDNGVHFNFAAEPQERAPGVTQPRPFDDGTPLFGDNRELRVGAGGPPRTGDGAEKRFDDAFAALAYAGGPTKASPLRAPPQWLAWADIRGTGWTTSQQTGDIRGGQTNALLGVTRRFSPDLLAGVFGGWETFDYTSQLLNGRLKGDGWTVGGYLAWRIMTGVRFDAGLARSGISYDGFAGTASGTFPGQRWLATASLIGTYKTAPGFEIEPSLKVYALWEHEDAFTDTLGTLQGDRNFSNGRASAGAKLAYPWIWSPTMTLAPYVGLYADYYFTSDSAAIPIAPFLLPTEFLQGWSSRVTGGVGVSMASGARYAVGAEVGGLASDQFTNWSVRGRASLPF